MASISKVLAQTNKFPGRRRRHLRSVRPCVLQSGKGRTLSSICSALTCPGQHVSPCGRGFFRRWQRRTNLWRERTNLRDRIRATKGRRPARGDGTPPTDAQVINGTVLGSGPGLSILDARKIRKVEL